MESNTAEILFLVMFGVSISFSANNVITEIFPFGVGHIIKEGGKSFFIRACFVGITAILWSICLVVSLKFCKTTKPDNGFAYDVLTVLLLLLLASSSWLCDHIARVIFYPFRKIVNLREKKYSAVDLMFILIYFITALALFSLRKLIL